MSRPPTEIPDDELVSLLKAELAGIAEHINQIERDHQDRVAGLLEANNRYLAEAREARAEVAQMHEAAKGAAHIVTIAGSLMRGQAQRIERLEAEATRLRPFEVELRKITSELGDADDPFAAWEALVHLKNDAATEMQRIQEWVDGGCVPDDEGRTNIALLKGIADEGGMERCLACGEVLQFDDMVHSDISGGVLHDACAGESTEGFVNMDDGEPLAVGEPRPEPWRWGDRLMPKAHADEPLPKPSRKDGGEPCGECHLTSGEACDICGAIAGGPTPPARQTGEDR